MRATMISGRLLRMSIESLAVALLLLAFAGCASPIELFIPVYTHASQSQASAGDSAQANCTANKNTVCTIILANNKTSAGSLNWSVQGSSPAHAIFSPTSGTLTPGQRESLTVTFAGRVCAPSVTLLQSWSGSSAAHTDPLPLDMHATGDGC